MRRFVTPAIPVVLALVVATPVHAGYMIIRVILANTGGPATPGGGPEGDPYGGLLGTPGDAGRPTLPGGPPQGSGLGPPGGIIGGLGSPPGYPMPPAPGTPGGTNTPPAPATSDPTRSLVVVVPFDEDITRAYPFYKPNPPLIPYQNKETNPPYQPQLRLTHRGQKIVANLFTDSSSVQLYQELRDTPHLMRTVASEVRQEYERWAKTKSNPQQLRSLITSALNAGMVEEAVKYADELLAWTRDKKDLPGDLAAFARAYGAVQKAIKGSAPKAGKAEFWRARLEAADVFVRGHYAIVYWDASAEELQRRADLLEENLKAFYLLHALQGLELPVPETPFTVILPREARDTIRFARILDGPPRLVTDGFYSTEHDVLVLAPERLDNLGLTFSRQVQQLYVGGVSRERLLAGGGPRIHVEGKKDEKRPDEIVKTPDEVARMQTLALVERFVEDNAAVHTVSREATRQLLTAVGLLPRHVLLPEWLANATADAFARPKDPPFFKDPKGKWFMTVAMTTGYGVPNYVLQRQFRDLVEKKELNPDRAALLRNVVTDAYFHGLRDPREVNDPDPEQEDKTGIALTGGGQPPAGGLPGFGGMGGYQPPIAGGGSSLGPRPGSGGPGIGLPPGAGSSLGPPPLGGAGSLGPPPAPGGPPGLPGLPGMQPSGDPAADDPVVILRKKRERLTTKAHATAWALYYYISRERPSEYRRFLAELAAMPRDFPLEGEIVLNKFCEAFGLDGSDESLKRFATAWVDWMRTVPQVGIDVPLVEPKPPAPKTGGPGTPLGPGGGLGSVPDFGER